MNAAPPPDPVSGGSLRLRLLAGTLAWMLLSIALAGWGLRALFQDHITQQLQAQLVMQLDHLSGAVDWGPDARVRLAPMAGDARLNRPLSGLYWQIDRLGPQPQAALARSRSLWDQTLALPLTEDATQGDQVLALRGAQGHELLAVARTLLSEHIYAQDSDRDSNTIEVFVGRLRKKLPVGSIETVRGLGYRLVDLSQVP